jgi:hypothetical protein
VNIGFFVSPHGFGHAARACAVMSVIAQRYTDVQFHIFTRVPPWFFTQSFGQSVCFHYHEMNTDVGFVQIRAMVEDYEATIAALNGLYPLSPQCVSELAALLNRLSVQIEQPRAMPDSGETGSERLVDVLRAATPGLWPPERR